MFEEVLHDGGQAEAGTVNQSGDNVINNHFVLKALGEIDDPGFITPDFVKACIRVVMCSMRLGDTNTAREAITLLNRLGEIPGISALCQAMISGVKVQNNSLDTIDRLEESGMDALRNKQFTQALEYLDKALEHAASCLRLKMARGDCLAHLGR